MPVRTPLFIRLITKVEHRHGSDCWWWTGATFSDGRGCLGMRPSNKKVLAYRLAYELFVGPIPEGLTIDHLCGHPECINPKHLEPVPAGVNINRHRNTLTHCQAGHEYTEENTLHTTNRRRCRTCSARWARDYRERRS